MLAAANTRHLGDPQVVDETLKQLDLSTVSAGDVIGIGIHTLNALRGYEVGRAARERGAFVIYGGIHSTLFPDEPFEHGGAQTVVKGDGDRVWAQVIAEAVPRGFIGTRWDVPALDYFLQEAGLREPFPMGSAELTRFDGYNPATLQFMQRLKSFGETFLRRCHVTCAFQRARPVHRF